MTAPLIRAQVTETAFARMFARSFISVRTDGTAVLRTPQTDSGEGVS